MRRLGPVLFASEEAGRLRCTSSTPTQSARPLFDQGPRIRTYSILHACILDKPRRFPSPFYRLHAGGLDMGVDITFSNARLKAS